MELLNQLRKMLAKEEKVRFDEIANEWLEYKRAEIKESTYYNYMFIVEKYLSSKFGGEKIREIHGYNEYFRELAKKLSSKTIRDITNVFMAILKYYESEYECKLRIKSINVPKIEKKRVKILSNREKEMLQKYCVRENTLKTLGIIVCLNTGMRIGEICALRWKNIDLENKCIYVEKTMQRVYNRNAGDTKILIDTPKTMCSIRSIPITDRLYNMLKPLKKKYKDNDYFLSGEHEKYVEPRNYQYTFKRILEKCKIGEYKFHILRHTFATNCIEVGMDAKTLSEILGHTDVSITLGVYVQSSYRIKKKYMEML